MIWRMQGAGTKSHRALASQADAFLNTLRFNLVGRYFYPAMKEI